MPMEQSRNLKVDRSARSQKFEVIEIQGAKVEIIEVIKRQSAKVENIEVPKFVGKPKLKWDNPTTDTLSGARAPPRAASKFVRKSQSSNVGNANVKIEVIDNEHIFDENIGVASRKVHRQILDENVQVANHKVHRHNIDNQVDSGPQDHNMCQKFVASSIESEG